jgi:preprotein translocase subunit YajC
VPDFEIVPPAENKQTTVFLMWLSIGIVVASMAFVLALILIERRRQRKREKMYSKIPPPPF